MDVNDKVDPPIISRRGPEKYIDWLGVEDMKELPKVGRDSATKTTIAIMELKEGCNLRIY